MNLPTVVNTEADKVFVNILNTQASSVTDGDIVVWEGGTADGVRTTQPAANTLSLVVGAVDGTVAASAYGLAQAYGYKSTLLISNDTSDTIDAGDVLVPVAAADYLVWSKTGTGLDGFFYAGETYDTNTTAPAATSKKGFIRAL